VLADRHVAGNAEAKPLARVGKEDVEDAPQPTDAFSMAPYTSDRMPVKGRKRAGRALGKMHKQSVRANGLIAVMLDDDFLSHKPGER